MNSTKPMTHQAGHADTGEPPERSARRANPIDAHVGSRVRLRRMLLGMSQERLAEQLGLTFQQVQKYEKGINRIGASRLYELSQLLNVGVDFFYEDAPVGGMPHHGAPGFADPTGENYIVDFLNSREGLELNRAFTRITDPKVRRAVIELVRSLAPDDAPTPAP
jgi:transcriptional regulator with XRE-family HTH domain